MKTPRIFLPLLLLLVTGIALHAQDPATPRTPAPAPTTPAGDATQVPKRTAEELEQIVGPIALYPDALIALILPASTAPADVVLAARHVRENPSNRSQIEHRAWDESVKSLTHYPEVLKWMDENLDWTKQLGDAFLNQPADVMQAIQRLRAKARAAGTLIDTPQQQVLAEPDNIRIVPAQPDVIYVPHYQPEIVFVDRPIYYGRPFLTFGVGAVVGSWLAYDCDWRRRIIWCGDRHRRWTKHDWHRPLVPHTHLHATHVHRHGVRPWCPPPVRYPRPSSSVTIVHHSQRHVVRPTPFGHAGVRPQTGHITPQSVVPSYLNRSSTLPTVAPLPHTFAHDAREVTGPHAPAATLANPAVVPPLPMVVTRPNPAATPPATVVAPPPAAARSVHSFTPAPAHTRHSSSQGAGDHPRHVANPRTRTHTPPATAVLPTVPALPSSAPMPAAVTGPVTPRTHSFSRSTPAPAAVPALPMAQRSAAPAATVAPLPQPSRIASPPPASAPAPTQHRGDNHRGRTPNQQQEH